MCNHTVENSTKKQLVSCQEIKMIKETIKSLKINIPLKNLIDSFEEVVKLWIDKIFFNSIQIRTLANLRDILLPKLISGKVKVNIS